MSYQIAPREGDDSPWPIVERLLQTHDELAVLNELLDAGLTLAIMFRGGDWMRQGRTILGKTYLEPSAQGDLKGLFVQLLEDTLGFYPDFLIMLNAEWWDTAPPARREVLMFHELLHPGQAIDRYGSPRFTRDGLPVACLNAHDLEEFNAVVRRYGAWEPGISEFLQAAEAFEGKPLKASADVF